MKIVGPRLTSEDGTDFIRNVLGMGSCFNVYRYHGEDGEPFIDAYPALGEWDNIDDAFAAQDQWLLDNGYRFVTEEEWNKLSLLL